jgi:3',5'-cyclic AMP phosphodiesterase CpdA
MTHSWRALLCAVVVAQLAAAACRGRDNTATAPQPTTLVRELTPAAGALALPLKTGSVRFAVIGDSGRGDRAQHEVAAQMVAWREKFPFDFVLMLGDNIYDRHTPQDYIDKFEAPYRALLDAGVTFHAAIGNHDDPASINYAKFNMNGRRFYSFRRGEKTLDALTGGGVRFFALDSRALDTQQLAWAKRELAQSGSEWKIAFFHHPIYTSGRYQSAASSLRNSLERVLIEGDVDVVFSGHEHFYERTHPQRGITYFVAGAAGSLRRGDIRATRLTAKGFDDDYSFMLVEVSGDELYFQAISRGGVTVDAGVITRPSS